MDIVTWLVYKALSPRLKEIDNAAANPEAAQRLQLHRILHTAKHTRFGREYMLNEAVDPEDYSARVPISEYDDLKPFIETMMQGAYDILVQGRCQWYAKSSGTSNDKSKFIPVPRVHLKNCHYRGATDSLLLYLRHRPESRFFSGKGLVLGGAFSPVAKGASRAGDLSSILISKMPWIGNAIRIPSKRTLLMSEWEAKMTAIVSEVKRQRVGSISGVPSWMLVMIKRILEETGAENLSEVWPSLEVFFHGGISFEPYREQYRGLIPSPRMRYWETYNASEGFFGIQDTPEHEAGMMLMLDYGVYYEFIPFSPDGSLGDKSIPLIEVETGRSYAMIISTLGGLYRYMIGDVVRFTSSHPYRIVIVGRTKSYINAFGEELMVDNAERALARVSAATGLSVTDYTAAPCFLPEEAKGVHEWIIEFGQNTPAPEVIADFAQRLDAELQALNSDYEAKRYADMTLLPLRLIAAPGGTFHRWMQSRGKLGGQHKVPRLSNSRVYFEALIDNIKQHKD